MCVYPVTVFMCVYPVMVAGKPVANKCKFKQKLNHDLPAEASKVLQHVIWLVGLLFVCL